MSAFLRCTQVQERGLNFFLKKNKKFAGRGCLEANDVGFPEVRTGVKRED
jgi:hypothetical protein